MHLPNKQTNKKKTAEEAADPHYREASVYNLGQHYGIGDTSIINSDE